MRAVVWVTMGAVLAATGCGDPLDPEGTGILARPPAGAHSPPATVELSNTLDIDVYCYIADAGFCGEPLFDDPALQPLPAGTLWTRDYPCFVGAVTCYADEEQTTRVRQVVWQIQ